MGFVTDFSKATVYDWDGEIKNDGGFSRKDFTAEEKQAMQAYQKQFRAKINSYNAAEFLHLTKARNGGYICPICGSGTGKNHTGGLSVKGGRLTCFARDCLHNATILDSYMKIHGITSVDTALKELCGDYDITEPLKELKQSKPAPKVPSEPFKPAAAESSENHSLQGITSTPAPDTLPPSDKIKAYYKQCLPMSQAPEAREYLTKRGFTADTLHKVESGILYDKNGKYIVFKVSDNYYCARDITGTNKIRYKNPAEKDGGVVTLPGVRELLHGGDIFVTEGIIDMLSVMQAGGRAISLVSANNAHKLIQWVNAHRDELTGVRLLLSLDNDDPGRKATAEIIEGLQGIKGITAEPADILGGCHDVNERLQSDSEGLTAAVSAACRISKRPDNTADYIEKQFLIDLDDFQSVGVKPTGYSNLDGLYKGIYSGLYIIGAISSLGKTTFTHQLCEQLARNGEHVIYFSLEQSKLELVAKSIARATALEDMETAISSIELRTGERQIPKDKFVKLIQDYKKNVGERLSIIDTDNLDEPVTADYIIEKVEKYIAANNVRPVVVVDYLQIIQNQNIAISADMRLLVDDTIKKMVLLKKKHRLPVILISSMNRANYLSPVDFESFKESGLIEYSADVTWGLQLEVMNDEIFTSNTKTIEKRETVKKQKSQTPRYIELVVLKDRYRGLQGSLYFEYFPQFDLFVPSEQHEIKIMTKDEAAATTSKPKKKQSKAESKLNELDDLEPFDDTLYELGAL